MSIHVVTKYKCDICFREFNKTKIRMCTIINSTKDMCEECENYISKFIGDYQDSWRENKNV